MNELITKLRKLNIELGLVDNRLSIKSPEGVMTPALLEEIKGSKNQIIDYIKNISGKNKFLTIKRADKKEFYVVSSAQRRLYFLHELDRSSLAYNIPQVLQLEGSLDHTRLSNAFNQLIERHESLRTYFDIVDDEPVQKILDIVIPEIEYFHLGRQEDQSTRQEDQSARIEDRLAENEQIENLIRLFLRPFDLHKGPLVRIGLIETGPQKYLLLVDMHHIITDGVSFSVLTKEFMALYNQEQLPSLEWQYKDYAEWQRGEEQHSAIARQKEFWINEFSEGASALELPLDFTRPLIKSSAGSWVKFEIDAAETGRLKTIAGDEGATLYMVILSAYAVLLSKLSNQEDIVIGTPTSGRQHADLGNIIGMFVNTLAVRTFPKGGLTFKEYLGAVKLKTLACFDNQAYPYEQLIGELKLDRDTGRNPFFDAMLVLQNFEALELSIPGLIMKTYYRELSISKFDLSLFALESEGRLIVNLEYSTALFRKETIDRFVSYFSSIITAITANPDKMLGDIEILPDNEKKQVLYEFNDTRTIYSAATSIITIFESQVKKTPENIAIRYGDKTMSYQELNELSEKIAYYLQETQGIKTGDLVGIMLEREEYLMPAFFGILKAGGVYVPIDFSYPPERIQSIVKDSGLKVLITRGKYLAPGLRLPKLVNLDEEWNRIDAMQGRRPSVEIKGNDLAYVIYTSGSTGKPKGVMIEHHSLLNNMQAMQDKYPLFEKDCCLLKCACSFDVSVSEMVCWFPDGGSLSLLEPGAEADARTIMDTVLKHKVTHMSFVPSLFAFVLEELDSSNLEKLNSLKYILLGGEALLPSMVKKMNSFNTGIVLANVYGPTEGTIYSSAYTIRRDREELKIPIGRPLNNVRLYVINNSNQPQPVNVAGELCIGGEGLARGYLNNSILTGEKFVHISSLPEDRVYRTGDLVRWLPDGDIEYLGRMDDQVKIRGFRIELGEIESQLCLIEGISEAAVLVNEGTGNKILVAYYVSEKEIPAAELKRLLANVLPGYMVPVHYSHLLSLPLNSNGKLNRKALPAVEVKKGDDYQAASNSLQEELVAIWADVLKLDKDLIGIHSNFFESGGHSINILSLCKRVNERYGCSVSVAEIFRLPTVKSMEDYIVNGERQIMKNAENIDEAIDEGSNNLRLLEGLLN